jgi:myosin-crossreactive antigen
MDNNKHISFLLDNDFNQEQIDFIVKQRENYLNIKIDELFDEDTYERDMWYTMNRSGLFENNKSNKSELTNWTVNDTRLYITEL